MKIFTRLNKFYRLGWLALSMLALLAALLITIPSFAQEDVTGSVTVSGGSLTMTAADNPTFTSVTLDGSAKTVSDPIDIDVQDLRGSGAGWHLEVTSTSFTNGSGKTLPTTALAITGVTSSCDGSSCTDPTNGTTYSVGVPAGATAPSAVEFFEAAVDTGLGDFTITPTFELSIPATTYAGTYTSTVTLTVANTP